ncbi:hypothetical protein MKW94_010010 [Papaver nudicaule]|uniref:CUE domain-containing protein n=1 Tax=Papaver nudicaule TaxID=74823 RepID=A0AA41SNC6_PAPNU|nr:hypothetical protein [Papaver nudicaule]
MSSRSNRGGFNNKSQQKYVPKNQNSSESTAKNSSSSPTPPLTTSLRDPPPSIHNTSTSSSSGSSSSTNSRVRIGDNGKWVSKQSGSGGNFVIYLPQDEAVAAGLGAEHGALDPVESQRVVDLLNRELSRLLKLNPRDFWKEVASDTSLHEFLDSFLKFRNRWYDFQHHGAKGIVAGVIVGEFELSRRVFMVLYRISSNRDPGALSSDSLSTKEHGALLQERNLLNVPKLIDICAIYGHENEELTNLLVMNAMRAQPSLHESLTAVVSHFLDITYTMHQRCNSSLEARSSSGQSGGAEDNDCRLISDFSEASNPTNSALFVSLDAFVSAYKPAALYFICPVEVSDGNGELLSTLARLHDSLLPSLQGGLRHIFSSGTKETQDSISGKLPNLAIGLKMLSVRLVSLGWKLLESCYLSDEVFEGSLPFPNLTKMFPAKVDDPGIRGDILVQTFKELNEEVSHDFWENKNSGTFLQNVEKYYKILRRLNDLRSNGWIFMDEDQFQYLSLIAAPNFPSQATNKEFVPITMGKNMQMDDDSAVTESKISQVKDLFPDYGKGFLAACLEVYNHNPEEVIQRILEGTLHEDLQSLDVSLETMPARKASLSKSRNDKGKGILVELTSATSPNFVSPVQEQRPEVSLSSLGRFTRKSRVDSINSKPLDLRVDEETAKAAILASQYEYEDEYDDSFDDLGLSFVETGFEETETLRDRISSSTLEKPLGGDTERPGQSKLSGGAKWNTKKTPQFYVKDGKNYSYKVAGSVAVSNSQEAALLNQTQKEMIHGLGRGGNHPIGAVKVMNEFNHHHHQQQPEESRNPPPNTWGRGKRGGAANSYQQDSRGGDARESGNPESISKGRGGRDGANHNQHQQGSRVSNTEVSGHSENFSRGRGGRGGAANHYQHQQGSREESGNSETFGRGRGGRGGGASHHQHQQHQQSSRVSGPEESRNSENLNRGRGRGRGGGSNHNQQQQDSEFEDSEENRNVEIPNRGRGGRRGGGRHNHYRKDQAMKKHFAGLGL